MIVSLNFTFTDLFYNVEDCLEKFVKILIMFDFPYYLYFPNINDENMKQKVHFNIVPTFEFKPADPELYHEYLLDVQPETIAVGFISLDQVCHLACPSIELGANSSDISSFVQSMKNRIPELIDFFNYTFEYFLSVYQEFPSYHTHGRHVPWLHVKMCRSGH